MKASLVVGSPRRLGTVAVVAGICGTYAGLLVMISAILATNSDAPGFGVILGAVATVFLAIALYVSAVVIVNCVDTVMAGMLPRIALLRLLGASASALRSAVTLRTTAVAAAGAVAGVAVGTAAAWIMRIVLVHHGVLRPMSYPLVSPWLVGPVGAVVLTTFVAARVGARAVLRVPPATAMVGATTDTPVAVLGGLRARLSLAVIGGGSVLLLVSASMGESHGTADGFLVAFLAAATTGTGLLLGARLVIPAVVGGLGRLLGDSPPSRIARRNAVKNPLRTTRTTMGLVIGVTLVTTFATGTDALRRSVHSWTTSEADRRDSLSALSTVTAVLVVVILFSAVIAAVGFVSTMSITVIERTREIGVLRALGFTSTQVRHMVVREAAALACSAIAFGIALGVVFGSVGAQALVGSHNQGFVWGRPWIALATIAAAGAALVLIASVVPARRAVNVAPVEALRTT